MSVSRVGEGASASAREASTDLPEAPQNKRKASDQQVATAVNTTFARRSITPVCPVPFFVPSPALKHVATGQLSQIFSSPLMKKAEDDFSGEIISFERFDFRCGLLRIILKLNYYFGSVPKKGTTCTFAYHDLKQFQFRPAPKNEGEISQEDLIIRCHYDVNPNTQAIKNLNVFIGFKKPFELVGKVDCRFLSSSNSKTPKPLEQQLWCCNY
jgi:hypothetical protein